MPTRIIRQDNSLHVIQVTEAEGIIAPCQMDQRRVIRINTDISHLMRINLIIVMCYKT